MAWTCKDKDLKLVLKDKDQDQDYRPWFSLTAAYEYMCVVYCVVHFVMEVYLFQL